MPVVLLNKPFRVLSRFRDDAGRDTLARYVHVADVYPAGRLDYDSEGLLILTDDGALQSRISEPRKKLDKHYWAQVEGIADDNHLAQLREGVPLGEERARAATATLIEEPPGLWPRTPPIRYRKSVPTSWVDISLLEGRNRQLRRMTAAAGLPTLRLIRHRIGPWRLDGLQPGETGILDTDAAWRQLNDYRR